MLSVNEFQGVLSRFLDCSDLEGKSRFLLLDDAERNEIANLYHALSEGRSVAVEGLVDPVPMDADICTARIRSVWGKSCQRRQKLASEILSGAGEDGTLGVIDQMLSSETPTILA